MGVRVLGGRQTQETQEIHSSGCCTLVRGKGKNQEELKLHKEMHEARVAGGLKQATGKQTCTNTFLLSDSCLLSVTFLEWGLLSLVSLDVLEMVRAQSLPSY